MPPVPAAPNVSHDCPGYRGPSAQQLRGLRQEFGAWLLQRSDVCRRQQQPTVAPERHAIHPRSGYGSSGMSPKNSAGVQINNLGNPRSSSNSYTRGKACALAMCRQFCVKRYSTPPTAAAATCKASSLAFGGIKERAMISSAICSTCSSGNSRGMPASIAKRNAAAFGSPSAASSSTN